MNKSIAHIREEDGKIQTVEEHLYGVQKLAESFGEKINVKHIAGLAGMLHDVGKYSDAFYHYILAAVNEPENAPARGSVDHSTAGGQILFELFHQTSKANITDKLLVEIVGNAIISHHSYLNDYLNPKLESPFLKRMEKDIDDIDIITNNFFTNFISKSNFNIYVKKARHELDQFLKLQRDHSNTTMTEIDYSVTLLTKYIFSCLIDAYRENTRRFVDNLESKYENQSGKTNQDIFYKHLELL